MNLISNNIKISVYQSFQGYLCSILLTDLKYRKGFKLITAEGFYSDVLKDVNFGVKSTVCCLCLRPRRINSLFALF